MIKTVVAKLVTVKAAAVLMAVGTIGGVSAAVGTGAVHVPGSNEPATPAHATQRGASEPLPTRSKPDGKSDGKPDHSPSPSLVGLCHAYLAKGGVERGKSLETPAFIALVDAAGGRDQVDTLCTGLLASADARGSGRPATGSPTATPTGHGNRPSDRPGASHAGRPTG